MTVVTSPAALYRLVAPSDAARVRTAQQVEARRDVIGDRCRRSLAGDRPDYRS